MMKNEDKIKFKLALTRAIVKLQDIVENNLPEDGVAKPVRITMPIVGTQNEAVFLFDNAAVPYIGKRTFVVGAKKLNDDRMYAFNALTGKDRSEILEYLKQEGTAELLAQRLIRLSDMADNN